MTSCKRMMGLGNRGYYTSAHILLNISNELRKIDRFFALSLINSIMHKCSIDVKTALKLHFRRENVRILWFIDFKTGCCITPRHDVI